MGPSLALLEHVFCCLNRPFDQLDCLGLRGLEVTWWNCHISKTSENCGPVNGGQSSDTTFSKCQILQIWLSFCLLLLGSAVFFLPTQNICCGSPTLGDGDHYQSEIGLLPQLAIGIPGIRVI